MRPFFRHTLAAVLITVANARGSARAEAKANAVDQQQLAPEIDPTSLPKETSDGRPIPSSRRHQFENAFRKLRRRGLLPRCPEASDLRVREVLGLIAALDEHGRGCNAGMEYLSRETDTCPTQIRVICAYAERHGFHFNFARVKADDRKLGGDPKVVTREKSTVRKIFPIPIPLLEQLTDDEVLDLIAFGDRKPRAVLRGLDDTPNLSTPVAAPASTPPLIELSKAELEQLTGAIAAVVKVHQRTLEVDYVLSRAQLKGVLDPEHVAGALEELADKNRPAESEAKFLFLVDRYLEGKAEWLKKGGDKARMSAQARDREEKNRALKTPEQLSREAGEVSAAHAPNDGPRTPPLKRARFLAEFQLALDEATRAAALVELDEAEERVARTSDPTEAWSIQWDALKRIEHLGRAPPKR